jgi:ABC-type transporter Mla MlaB component
MSATLSTNADRVSVRIDGNLGYDIWQILRDARNTALNAHLPLFVDMNRCEHIDMAGIGAVLLAQEKLSRVELCGCQAQFVQYLKAFGVCRQCSAAKPPVPDCPKSETH